MATEPAGTRIRKRRQALGLTQPQLALRVGVHRSAVSAWERGVQYPQRHLGRLEHVLGISLTDTPAPPLVLRDDVERNLWDALANVPQLTDAERRAVIEHRRRGRDGDQEPAGRPA